MKKHGIIAGFEYHKLGMSGFDGQFDVTAKQPRLVEDILVQRERSRIGGIPPRR